MIISFVLQISSDNLRIIGTDKKIYSFLATMVWKTNHYYYFRMMISIRKFSEQLELINSSYHISEICDIFVYILSSFIQSSST